MFPFKPNTGMPTNQHVLSQKLFSNQLLKKIKKEHEQKLLSANVWKFYENFDMW